MKDAINNEKLQSDQDLIDEEVETEEDTDSELQQSEESAASSEPEHLENTEDDEEQKPVNQEAVNKAIAKQHAKYREEQRRANEERKKREELEAKLREIEEKQLRGSEPQVPDIPDRFDYDSESEYREAIKQRDEALIQRQIWENQQQSYRAQQQQLKQQQELKKQQRLIESYQQYQKRIEDFGIDKAKMKEAGEIVGAYNLDQKVVEYILEEEKGALMTLKLAKDLDTLDHIASLEVEKAILYLDRNVRPTVGVSKRTTQAKKVPTRVKGSSKGSADYPLTGGATVE